MGCSEQSSHLLVAFVCAIASFAQGSSIISKEPLILHDSIYTKIGVIDYDLRLKLQDVEFFRITYLSDGLKVTGYLAQPKKSGKYPCIITNRGGSKDYGQWNPLSIAYFIGKMASWDYVVIATQYRGNDGGEGTEDFGGDDVHDILNLIPVLKETPKADDTRIGIEGTSRGGMMTYLALKNNCSFKAAVVTAGAADASNFIKYKPETEPAQYTELIPQYNSKKDVALFSRSAIYWSDQICESTPLLIMHGSADNRVQPTESLELVKKLLALNRPVRFILFEGAGHGIKEFKDQRFNETKRHFDFYVRDGNNWPGFVTID